MKTFTVKGLPIAYKFYNWLYERSVKKAKKLKAKRDNYSDKTFNVLSAIFISPRALAIKYDIEQTESIYELIVQNDFKEQAKIYNQTKEMPEDVKLEDIIRSNHDYAFKIENYKL